MAFSPNPSRKSRRTQWVVGLLLLAAFMGAFLPEVRSLFASVLSVLAVLARRPDAALIFGPDTFRGGLVLIVNLVVFAFVSILVLVLVSQFVLPVQTPEERMRIFNALFSYPMGMFGPVIAVREGRVISSEDEEKRPGPGVVMVDSCSAIVLEPAGLWPGRGVTGQLHRLTGHRKEGVPRVVGPGIVFMRYDEHLRGVVDLRNQTRVAVKVCAYTRDGIEVTTNVFVVFTLGQPPEVLSLAYEGDETAENLRVVRLNDLVVSRPEGQRYAKVVSGFVDELDEEEKAEVHFYVQNARSQNPYAQPFPEPAPPPGGSNGVFRFYPERVFNAIYSQIQGPDGKPSAWTDLPPYVGTDIFRSMLQLEVYDNLYLPNDPVKFPLKDFKAKFGTRMRHLGVLSFQFAERRDGTCVQVGQEWDAEQMLIYPVQEFRQPRVLRRKGIKVIVAGFTELKPAEAVRQRLLDNWQARWERDAELALADHELHAMRIVNRARAQAQQELTGSLSQILKSSTHSREALAVRIYQALETAATDPATRQLLPSDTINMLRSLRYWLLPEKPGVADLFDTGAGEPGPRPPSDRPSFPEDREPFNGNPPGGNG